MDDLDCLFSSAFRECWGMPHSMRSLYEPIYRINTNTWPNWTDNKKSIWASRRIPDNNRKYRFILCCWKIELLFGRIWNTPHEPRSRAACLNEIWPEKANDQAFHLWLLLSNQPTSANSTCLELHSCSCSNYCYAFVAEQPIRHIKYILRKENPFICYTCACPSLWHAPISWSPFSCFGCMRCNCSIQVPQAIATRLRQTDFDQFYWRMCCTDESQTIAHFKN